METTAIKFLFRRHFPLIISFFGAFALFCSSLLIKIGSSNELFVEYGRAVIVASMAFTWAPLGWDGYFSKVSELRGDRIFATLSDYSMLLFTSIIGSTILAIFSVYYLSNGEGGVFKVALISVLVCVCLLLFTFSRILGDNFLSQYFSSLWKVAFLLAACFLYSYSGDLYSLTFFIGSFLILLIFPLIKTRIFSKLKVSQASSVFQPSLWLATLYTITVVTLLSQMDRLLTSRYLTDADFAEYFFWSSIYFSPMTIFASYYGAKRFNGYKSNTVSKKDLYKDVCIVLLFVMLSVVVSSFIGVILSLIYPEKIVLPSKALMVGVICLGAIRAVYIYVANIIQIYIEPRWAFKTGSILIIFISILIGLLENIDIGLIGILVSLIFMWAIRTAQYFFFLKSKVEYAA